MTQKAHKRQAKKILAISAKAISRSGVLMQYWTANASFIAVSIPAKDIAKRLQEVNNSIANDYCLINLVGGSFHISPKLLLEQKLIFESFLEISTNSTNGKVSVGEGDFCMPAEKRVKVAEEDCLSSSATTKTKGNRSSVKIEN